MKQNLAKDRSSTYKFCTKSALHHRCFLLPEHFTMLFNSVIIHGRLNEIAEDEEKICVLRLICKKYATSNMLTFERVVKKGLKAMSILKMSIDEITAKYHALQDTA